MNSQFRGMKRRRERKALNQSRGNIDNILQTEFRNKRIKVWVTDEDPKKGADYFIVEIRLVKPLRGLQLESILTDRLSDLFEE